MSFPQLKNLEFLLFRMPDRLGIFLSALCLAHCLIIPPLLAMAPLFVLEPLPASMHDSEWFHAVLLLPVFLISGPALGMGGRYDKNIWIIAAVAFGLLALALTFESHNMEQATTVAGAILLIIAHLKNRRIRNLV